MMNEEPKITVFYEKFFIDDTGKHIPDLFSKNNVDNICIKSYWGNTIDAFFRYSCLFMFTSVVGDFRIVTAYEHQDGYKFNQFFMSGLDGKVIKIPKDTWFGVNNMKSSTGSLIMGKIGSSIKFDTMNPSIFDWYSKR